MSSNRPRQSQPSYNKEEHASLGTVLLNDRCPQVGAGNVVNGSFKGRLP